MATIALVGRPNVGKSTLFNRIAGTRVSIVHDQPGVTRDRVFARGEWLTQEFDLVDTGGLTLENAPFQKEIAAQVQIAIDEADLIVFVTSARDGVRPDDRYIAKLLKKLRAPRVLVAANKAESRVDPEVVASFMTLGFGAPFLVSAEHGIGVGDMLDEAVKRLKELIDKTVPPAGLKLAIIGKPNVGKSTLVNALVGEPRAIVSPVAGTTRDATDTTFKRNKQVYTIIDTAGIRRKGKVYDDIERYAVLRAEKAIARCDFVLIVIDGSIPLEQQDEVVAGLAHGANIPTVIVVNKWDGVLEKESNTMPRLEKELRARLPFMAWAPMVFVSALENRRTDKLFETIARVQAQLKTRVAKNLLNEVVAKAQISNLPPKHKNGRLEILEARQVESKIPTFVLFCNNPEHLHFTYARYLENQIREAFGLTAVPLTLYFKSASERARW